MKALRSGRLNLVAAVAVVVMSACARNPMGPTGASSASPISPAVTATGTWSLQSFTRADSSTVTIAQPELFTLQLGDASRVLVRADCNHGTGLYSVDGNTLMIGPLAVTKAYCGSASFDNEFLQLLGGITAINTTPNSLELSSARGTLHFGR